MRKIKLFIFVASVAFLGSCANNGLIGHSKFTPGKQGKTVFVKKNSPSLNKSTGLYGDGVSKPPKPKLEKMSN